MYKLLRPIISTKNENVFRFTDTSFIPFQPLNSDYQKFKLDIEEGAELQDVDGNVMTPEQVQEFMETLP